MARSFDRRWLLARGCAAISLAACTGKPPAEGPEDTGEPATGSPGDDDDTTAPADTYPCNQQISPGGPGWEALPLADWPDLAEVGGWYGVTIGGTEIIVAHIEQDCYTAILRACTHEGQAIDYSPQRRQFVCPRHAAIYDEDGDKVAGPQPAGLPVFPCGRDGDTVWVKVD